MSKELNQHKYEEKFNKDLEKGIDSYDKLGI